MEDIRIKNLLNKLKEGTCTPSERDELLQWLSQFNEDQTEVQPEVIEQIGQEVRQELLKLKGNSTAPILWTILSTVAAFTLIAFITFFYFKSSTAPVKSVGVKDILPGSNRATITLANGKIINLSSAKKGVVINSTGLTYTDGTTISNSAINDIAGHATITTPKGGEYQIVLSDGTEVWLNAATILQYPVSFKSQGTRAVKLLSGEAYFQVAKDRQKPFVVTSARQKVLVLGTHFNINLYNAGAIKTTLVEGSVKVYDNDHSLNSAKILVPGQQAVNDGKVIVVNTVDTDIELAWKDGKIQFEEVELKTVMEMLTRWYNIEVEYQYYPSKARFSGSIARSKEISEILELLQATGDAHFKIDGRRILIMK